MKYAPSTRHRAKPIVNSSYVEKEERENLKFIIITPVNKVNKHLNRLKINTSAHKYACR